MTTDDLLRRQWDTLVGWLRAVDVERHADLPSGLAGWSVGDLVAHLGYGIGMVAEIRAAPDGDEPLSLGQYVAAYPPAAEQIAEQTRAARSDWSGALLDHIGEVAAAAWRAAAECDAAVVLGRRGPLSRPDYLTTRLLELVVHADDLQRALPDASAAPGQPVLPEALDTVAGALAEAYRERTGARPQVTDPAEWVRRATGRVATDDPTLPLL